MKKFSLIGCTLLFFFNLSTAQARIEGIVQGRITVTENRNLAFVTAVTAGTLPPTAPVRRVIVSITALGDGSGGNNPTFFAITDGTGSFSSRWRDDTRDAFPGRLRITVFWEATTAVGFSQIRPSTLFRIERMSGGSSDPRTTFERTLNSSNPNLGNLNAGANDETAAYLTTEQFFRNIVSKAPAVHTRMLGLVVRTRVPGFNFMFGVTPLSSQVFVSETTPASNPMVLAHELGHALTWNALGLTLAPLVPATDYIYPPGGLSPTWDRTTREFSKAAFLEGMADAWALEWAFGSDVNAVFRRGNLTFDVERAIVRNASGAAVVDCEKDDNAHEFPFCQTAAIRDLLDDDGNGGDGVNLSRQVVINTLSRFRNCTLPGNGCLNEPGVDGLNHHDFRCNALGTSRRAKIRKVWRANEINDGPASSCPK